MNLANYLILPVQRLPRYEILLEVSLHVAYTCVTLCTNECYAALISISLFIQGLKRYTVPEHVDYQNILDALEKVLAFTFQLLFLFDHIQLSEQQYASVIR